MGQDLIPTFMVGTIPVYGNKILAPMDGFSDLPFRGMARRLGSAMSYTEFVNAIHVINQHPKLDKRLAYEEFERPVIFQLYDDEPERLLQASLTLMERRPDMLDINMGCSTRHVSGRGAGAGLLRSPHKVAKIFATLSKALPVPITAKIRLGWDRENRNYLQIARIIEESGGQLIAVHGRTKQQGYRGEADLEAIAEIKHSVSIPVIGNGDVRTTNDIDQMLEQTGCDGVMIGRAAIGNPWLFRGLNRHEIDQQQVKETMLIHLQRMRDFYGAQQGLVLFRKHIQGYISPYPLSQEQRRILLTCENAEQFTMFLEEIYFTLSDLKEEAYVQ